LGALAVVAMLGTPVLAQDGAATPEALFEAAQKASAAKDTAALVRLVAPSERVMLAFTADMGVDMMSEMWKGESAQNLKARYAETKKKYKIPDPPEGETLELGPDTSQEKIEAHIRKRAEAMYAGVDAAGYAAELLGLVLTMPEMADRPIVPAGSLSDLTVEGDGATAKIGDQEVHFVREGGRWYLSGDLLGG
jgi:hypothetical protein